MDYLIEHANDPIQGRFLRLAVDRRPAEELFDIRSDPACLDNLAESAEHASMKEALAAKLESFLRETKDPRMLDGGEIFETYRRYSRLRAFPQPDWAKSD